MIVWEISIAAALGLIFGSFLNVCISRLPHDQSVITPRSHCPRCGKTIAWYDNIPVLSWILLVGRCRNCKEAISWRYPLVELANAGLWVACYLFFFRIDPHYDAPLAAAMAVAQAFFCFLLLGLAVMDWETLILPDEFTWTGIATGILGQSLWSWLNAPSTMDTIEDMIWVIVRTALAALLILIIRWLYLVIRKQEGMGLGDAKLMAMLAAWLGFERALLTFFLAVITGAIFSLILLAVNWGEPQKWSQKRIPLGTFLCLSGIYSAFYGAATLQWYLALLQ